MRALTGAIITAAALIGLGLTALGIGNRYQNFLIYEPVKDAAKDEANADRLRTEPDFKKSQVRISDLDGPMKLCLTILVLTALTGLGITFVGLMYHHHKRYHEHLRLHGQASTMGSQHITS
jgi:hypothetical protein